MTAKDVVDEVVSKAMLDQYDDWALFEIFNDLGLERPLKEWEIVMNLIQSWEKDTENAIMIRPYAYRSSLSYEAIKREYPLMCGWLYLEVKRGKFQKRYFTVKDNGVYHAKDQKMVGMTLLCTLESHDVYRLFAPRKKAPTKFCFALKSQQMMSYYEDIDKGYVYYLCAEHLDKMKDWILSIRSAKVSFC